MCVCTELMLGGGEDGVRELPSPCPVQVMERSVKTRYKLFQPEDGFPDPDRQLQETLPNPMFTSPLASVINNSTCYF